MASYYDPDPAPFKRRVGQGLGVLLTLGPNHGRRGEELRTLHASGAAILWVGDRCGHPIDSTANGNAAMLHDGRIGSRRNRTANKYRTDQQAKSGLHHIATPLSAHLTRGYKSKSLEWLTRSQLIEVEATPG